MGWAGGGAGGGAEESALQTVKLTYLLVASLCRTPSPETHHSRSALGSPGCLQTQHEHNTGAMATMTSSPHTLKHVSLPRLPATSPLNTNPPATPPLNTNPPATPPLNTNPPATPPFNTNPLLRLHSIPTPATSPLTVKHVETGLWTVLHGIHEDDREELGENDAHFGPHQLVSDHLAKERGSLLSNGWNGGVAEQVQKVDQSTCSGGWGGGVV